jgi:hypothetical protein
MVKQHETFITAVRSQARRRPDAPALVAGGRTTGDRAATLKIT